MPKLKNDEKKLNINKTKANVDTKKKEGKAKAEKKSKPKKSVKVLTKKQKETELKELKNAVNLKLIKKEAKAKPVTEKIAKKFLPEYYDLPYRYNETVVKILAQTPKRLFVYWDIADSDRKRYLNAFGEDFFEKTYPVLLIHNEEMNYTFEVPINDFANSWYLDIKDPKTKYVIQLGRKFRNVNEIRTTQSALEEEKIDLKNDYIFITNSNELEAPNDHILFERMPSQVTYRNVKNGNEFKKNVADVLGKLQSTYEDADLKEMYKKLYGDEISEEEYISNPSSGGMPTSSFK